jgi:NADH:ubiquinone oxidoreductase subunit 3 (subunit A)
MDGLRRTLAVVTLWLPAATILWTWMLWEGRLPADLPTHWGVGGPADGVTSAPVFLGWLLGVSAAAALIGSIVVLAGRSGARGPRAAGAVTGGAAAFVLGMWLGSTVPSLDAADPFTVHIGAWVLVTLMAPCYGLLQLALLPRGATSPVEVEADAGHPHPAASLPVRPWSRTVSSRMFIGATLLLLVLGVVLFAPTVTRDGVASLGWTAIIYLAVLLLVAALCVFRVTVDERGLRITSGLLGIPLKRIAPAKIAAIEVTTLEPMQWGGWGYRIMPGRSAIILRRGPGLVITQHDERQFAITLDEPEEPASTLLALATTEDRSSS